jgi:aryl-alcohol dehydrogenase-like predicted oxidoreductase
MAWATEMLLGRALAGRRQQVLLSVKFGAVRAPTARLSARYAPASHPQLHRL